MEFPDLLGAGLGLVGVVLALVVPAFVEWSRRPCLRVVRRDGDDANSKNPYWRIVHVRVVNEPLSGWLSHVLLRNPAMGCRVKLEFKSTSDGMTTGARGKWSAKPEPLTLLPTGPNTVVRAFDAEKIPQALTIDLSPSKDGEPVAVAIKHNNDLHAFAYDPDVYAEGNLRNDAFQLADERYEVTITATAGEISSEPCRFLLHNSGSSPRDLRLEAVG